MAGKKKAKEPSATIAQNRRARHDYDILETFEAGLVLLGTEVKSLRAGHGNITEAYVIFRGREAWLFNASIPPYSHGGTFNHEERRDRKLLMHRRELDKIARKKDTGGLTLVPLRLYWKHGRVKVEIALGRGRKKYDKRHATKQRDWQRQQDRLMRQ